MKRAIVYLAFFLANAVPADNESVLSGVGELTVSDLKQYEVFYCKADPFCVLVVAKDRAWGAAGRRTKPLALSNAMRACKLVSTMPHTCEVVDVNGDSGLLKKYLEKKGRSTIFASKKVWCANKKSVFLADQKYCNSRTDARGFSTKAQAQAEHQRLKGIAVASNSNDPQVWCVTDWGVEKWLRSSCSARGGKIFTARYQAQAEHQRLKNQTTTASTSGSKSVWCAGASSSYVFKTTKTYCKSINRKSFPTKAQAQAEHERLKGIATASTSASNLTSSDSGRFYCYESNNNLFYIGSRNGCVGSDKKISKREFTNRRLDSNTTATASSALTTGWCSEPKTSGGRLYQRIATKCEGKIFATYDEAAAEYNRIHSIVYPEIGPYDTIWCANKLTVAEYKKWNCDEISGTAHRSKSLAQAEHQRLKNQTSTASSNQASQQTTARTDSAEIVFWQSIKDSNDPDMFQAYLTKYPEGEFVLLAKININKLSNTAVANVAIPNLDYGNYHALVIGNDRYQYLDNLKTPRHDAKLIAATLKRDYGFDVNLISNATRADMFAALEHYRRTSTPQDNLLIYYAGHGVLDQEADEGFWLPVDAKEDSQLNWIPNADIIRSVSSMQAKHVMVVADSCFSGTLIRALTIKQRTPDYLSRLSKKKARVAMTSGSEEPVTDVGGGGNSAFAKAFLTLLDENTGVMDGHSMFTQLRRRVMINTKQTPRYGDMRGHEDGEFLFVRQ